MSESLDSRDILLLGSKNSDRQKIADDGMTARFNAIDGSGAFDLTAAELGA
jgi:hypothetical protein